MTKHHGKSDVLAIVPDARCSLAKGGWIITSVHYGELNDNSFASAREAWADAYDTVRMGWHKLREASR